jgi:GDP-D-mannose 3', 5'-epimerase
MAAAAAGIEIRRVHVPGPQGVRGRNSDNTRVRDVLGWSPRVPLEDGLARTYRWIERQVRDRYFPRAPAAATAEAAMRGPA